MTDECYNKPSKMRVAQIIGRLTVGGAERNFVSLCNAMPDSHITAFFVADRQDLASLRKELDQNIDQVDVVVRKRSLIGGIFRLSSALKAARCDVVHTHMFWPSLYGCLGAYFAGVPVVVTTEHGENRWKRGWHRWLEKQVISRIADRRFCVSPDILCRRRDSDGVPESKLRVISNGTPLPTGYLTGINTETPLIGSIGRLVKQKNFCMLVDSVAELRRQGYSVRATIVGDGPELDIIRARISSHGLSDVVDLPGFDTDTDRRYREFDIYVNSSVEEGQPISILEAMSYSLPIVACDVGAISETIQNGEEGIIIPPDNVEALTEALKRFITNSEMAEKYGSNARKRVMNDFSIQKVAKEYKQHYIDIWREKADVSADRSKRRQT